MISEPFAVIAAIFWADINYFRAVSFASGVIGLIILVVSLCGFILNHGTLWSKKNLLIPMAKTNFFIACAMVGRKKPPTMDQLTKQMKDFEGKSKAIDTIFEKLFEEE